MTSIQKLRDMNLHAVADELIRLRTELESCEKLLKLSGRVNSKLIDEMFAFKKPRYKRADDLSVGDTVVHDGDETFIESIEIVGGYVRINESETLSPPEAQMKMVYPEPLASSADKPAEKLTAPARVGSTIFGVGVDTGAVIERAQREYEYRAALKSEPAVAVPDGWRLVPVVITDEMFFAFSDAAAGVSTTWSDATAEEKAEAKTKVGQCWTSMLAAATSHSQKSETSTNIWESALLDAANAVVHANQNNTGYEPSRSLLAYRIDELRKILDDANVDYPGYTDRCPSHDSEQGGAV